MFGEGRSEVWMVLMGGSYRQRGVWGGFISGGIEG